MAKLEAGTVAVQNSKTSFLKKIITDIKQNNNVYIMMIPIVAFYAIFCYMPMYGAIIAFKDFSPGKSIFESDWIGFVNFIDFFNSPFFFRTLKNTLSISIGQLIFGFPIPIILALLINEIRNKHFKSTVQTVTYLPHFISLVVVCGMIKTFTASGGIITNVMGWLGGTQDNLLLKPEFFQPIYISSGIWQQMGWDSIIYLAALSAVDPQLYESARIDGANRWKQMLNITLPGILPTILILLVLRIGNLLSIGFEKIILLYSPNIYETADVISTFVYRKGLQEFSWSFSTAVQLFNSTINFILLASANWMSKKINDSGLW